MIGSNGFRVSGFGRRRASAAVLCCVALAAGVHANAEPYVPSDAGQVLERLTAREGADWQAIATLQADLARTPRDAALAAELARRHLALFRVEGDPRFIAYARRALAAWAAEAEPPLEIAAERAQIAQTEHRFEAARAELERVLARSPRASQAWLTLSALDVLRADYAAARRECSRLVLLEDSIVAGGCLAAVQAMTGEAARAYEFLERELAARSALPPAVAAWLQTLAAEIAEALGRGADAEAHYRAALESEQRPSVYLLAAYADFLLGAGRADDVIALLGDAPPADPLLLRLALAEKRAGRDVAKRVSVLGYRLELALDGRETHAREAAYFALYLLERPALALDSALANWTQQREAIDARLVLEAALAANRPEAAQPVVEWLDANRIEHVDLRRLGAAARPAP
jgi:hypothetical protein